ncbi:GTPase-associated protein 1-related protein [Dactylosporangium salmoneum]|uniref:GTPase-associated protein 1-related protein n=1 Tax=Dactylosporangium salmoneum TaxID=53361 RepID=UPI0031DBB216
MALQQLYYTSCEEGLSGHAGFQFAAVSEGVSPALMRHVEALSAYDPPRSLAYPRTPEELAACPQNLGFAPGAQGDVVFRAVYVGRDFSERFGNYFVHALAGPDLRAELAGALPIELWGAPMWRATPDAGSRLAPLAGVERGPLDRRGVAGFVARHGHGAGLAGLLTAAARAQSSGRSVLLVERGAEEAAHWIAAACYLLPREVAESLSFATFQRRPSPGRLHICATLDETVREAGTVVADMALYDFVAGRFADRDGHPLARLLVRIGMERAEEAWRTAATFAVTRPAAGDWDAWHPLVAAATPAEVRFEPEELAALAGWLRASAAALGAARTEAIGRRLLDHAELADAHLWAVAEAARTAGATAVADAATVRVLGRELRAVVALGLGPRPAYRLPAVGGGVRGPLAEQCAAAMDRAAPGVRLAVALWAEHYGVPVDPAVLRRCGTALGERLDAVPADLAEKAVARLAPVHAGLAAHLVAAAGRRRPEVMTALAGRAGKLLELRGLEEYPLLRELNLVRRARERRDETLDCLRRILPLRPDPSLDQALLDEVRPGGDWSLAETIAIVDALQRKTMRAPDRVVVRLAADALRRPVSSDSLEDHFKLTYRLSRTEWWTQLPAPVRGDGERLLDLNNRLNGPLDAESVREIMGREPGYTAAARVLFQLTGAPGLVVRATEARYVVRILQAGRGGAYEALIRHLDGRGGGRPDDRLLAQVAGLLIARRGTPDALRGRRDRVLGAAVKRWPMPELERLGAVLDGIDPESRKALAGLMSRHGRPARGERLGARLLHLVGRLLGSGPRKGPAGGA